MEGINIETIHPVEGDLVVLKYDMSKVLPCDLYNWVEYISSKLDYKIPVMSIPNGLSLELMSLTDLIEMRNYMDRIITSFGGKDERVL